MSGTKNLTDLVLEKLASENYLYFVEITKLLKENGISPEPLRSKIELFPLGSSGMSFPGVSRANILEYLENPQQIGDMPEKPTTKSKAAPKNKK